MPATNDLIDPLPPLTEPEPNDDAVRLYLVDMALLHLGRNQGILGLGSNAVAESLREEKNQIVARLRRLGERLEPPQS